MYSYERGERFKLARLLNTNGQVDKIPENLKPLTTALNTFLKSNNTEGKSSSACAFLNPSYLSCPSHTLLEEMVYKYIHTIPYVPGEPEKNLCIQITVALK